MSPMPDLMLAGIKMIAALGVVLALVLLMLVGLRKLAGQRIGGGSAKRIQVLESHYMGVKKSIALVRVPGKVLVLGLCGDRINLLDTLEETLADTAMAASDSDRSSDGTGDGTSGPFGSLLAGRLKKLRRCGL